MESKRVTVAWGALLSLLEQVGTLERIEPGPGDDTLRAVRDSIATLLESLDDAELEPAERQALDAFRGTGRRARTSGIDEASSLCRRERETLEWLLTGASEKEIAAQLGISVHTVHQYVKTVYRRFGVSSRAQLMARRLRAS